jgi:transposase
LCVQQEIPFVLGHALYMRAIRGGKTKNDKIDSQKIARLLRGGNFPMSYVYPRQMRSTRDLLRRRCFLVRRRGELLAHLNNTFSQYNVTLAGDFDRQLTSVELYLKRNAMIHDPDSFHRLKTVPGIGDILAMVLLYEIHDIRRFADVGDFVSCARLVRGSHESAGKAKGSPHKKIGNAHLKWAFFEATTLLMRECEGAKRFVERKTKKHNKPKAMSGS